MLQTETLIVLWNMFTPIKLQRFILNYDVNISLQYECIRVLWLTLDSDQQQICKIIFFLNANDQKERLLTIG